jgi:hydroxyacylglutathione hydrolase
MNLLALPAFSDNYIWLLHDGTQALVVDPGDAAPVTAALDRLQLKLAAILVTHHHPDHVGGVDALRPRLQNPQNPQNPQSAQGSVFGPAREAIPTPFTPVRDGDVLTVLGQRFEVLDVPGHTAGHVAYFQLDQPQAPLLFCGDTLFSGGCGRLFEGTPAQMHRSLSRMAALPGDTRVCCAHEYTLSNLRFAQAVEPGNAALAAYQVRCQGLRDAGQPTLPSSIALERDVNPFLRCAEPAVVQAARAQGAASADPVDVLAALREWKNRF